MDVNIELASHVDFSANVMSIDAERLRLASPPGSRSKVRNSHTSVPRFT